MLGRRCGEVHAAVEASDRQRCTRRAAGIDVVHERRAGFGPVRPPQLRAARAIIGAKVRHTAIRDESARDELPAGLIFLTRYGSLVSAGGDAIGCASSAALNTPAIEKVGT